MNDGFIQINESVICSVWYGKPVVSSVFIHCLLSSRNYTLETSARQLALETGLKQPEILTALVYLEAEGHIKFYGLQFNMRIEIRRDDSQYRL